VGTPPPAVARFLEAQALLGGGEGDLERPAAGVAREEVWGVAATSVEK
jgi:hypothetical protein